MSDKTNVIQPGAELRGILKFEGGLEFDGLLEGEIHCSGTVTVGEHGEVRGNINAESIIVVGKVNGDLDAAQVTLKPSGIVIGTITYTHLQMEEGSTLTGKVERRQTAAAA